MPGRRCWWTLLRRIFLLPLAFRRSSGRGSLRSSDPPEGLFGRRGNAPESARHGKYGNLRGQTFAQRLAALDRRIMAANPFNGARLIQMFSNVDVYLREFARFVFFLLLLVAAYSYRRNVGDEFRVSQAVRARLDTPFGVMSERRRGIADVVTETDFWHWMAGPAGRTLFPRTNMNGNPLTTVEKMGQASQSRAGGQYALVGPVRLRQSRVRPLDQAAAQSAASMADGSLSYDPGAAPGAPSGTTMNAYDMHLVTTHCRRGTAITEVNTWFGPCYAPYSVDLVDRPRYDDWKLPVSL
jgi:hypothetical protein